MADKGPSRSDLRHMAKLLKQMMRGRKNLPKYEEYSDSNIIANTNCYAYAFDVQILEDNHAFFGFLGWTIGKYEQVPNKQVSTERLMVDIARMGFKAEETKDAGIPEKGFKIAFFFLNDGDFHFMRLDEDGTWSEKNGYGGEIRKVVDEQGNPMLPEDISYGYDEFVAYYWIHH